jgi:ABC-2 type transport system permease protein
MNAFWGFIRKEFLHIFRDRRTMVILFGLPLAQLLIFGYAIRNELNSTGIAILDQSRDEQTRLIIDKIVASDYFDVTVTERF